MLTSEQPFPWQILFTDTNKIASVQLIGEHNRLFPKDNRKGSGGATWALEVADQSMVCPIIVEDLSQPGLMLIEVCEWKRIFLREFVGFI